ncbi:hypothetical protein M378DRAFT_43192, partial [Amanita muscaria Koide BX008]
MHLVCLNIPPLLLDLWQGHIEIEYNAWEKPEFIVLDTDHRWQEHGKLVESSSQYLPGFFGRTPRNPSKKINSGYKACEYQIYIWVLGSALFRLVLPPILWMHYCKLVRAVHIILQRRITPEELSLAHRLLLEWENEYELQYYQRRADHLNLVRPCVHSIAHAAMETARCGPLNLVAQWTLENTIGNLGREVRQPSNPFSNLSERGLLRAQINALTAVSPGMESEPRLPSSSRRFDNGYILLSATDTCERRVQDEEETALRKYLL